MQRPPRDNIHMAERFYRHCVCEHSKHSSIFSPWKVFPSKNRTILRWHHFPKYLEHSILFPKILDRPIVYFIWLPGCPISHVLSYDYLILKLQNTQMHCEQMFLGCSGILKTPYISPCPTLSKQKLILLNCLINLTHVFQWVLLDFLLFFCLLVA